MLVFIIHSSTEMREGDEQIFEPPLNRCSAMGNVRTNEIESWPRSLLGYERCSKTIGQSLGLLPYRLERRAHRTIKILFLVDLGSARCIFDRLRDDFNPLGRTFKSKKKNRRQERLVLVFFRTLANTNAVV